MKLFILTARDPNAAPFDGWYCVYTGVVRAADEAGARRLMRVAADKNGASDACAGAWEDPALTTCAELAADGAAGVIVHDSGLGV